MIYIIDNGQPPMDYGICFVEVSDSEAALFGEALEPLLLCKLQDHGYTKPFIMGVAQNIQWRKGVPGFVNLSFYLDFYHIIKISDNYQAIHRASAVPPLDDAMIDYIIQSHISHFPKDEDRYMGFVEWDDVRAALKEGK